MKKPDGYDQAASYTGEIETIEPGGYPCVIVGAEVIEYSWGDVLALAYDISDGKHKWFYKRLNEKRVKNDANAKWPGIYRQTMTGKGTPFLKGIIKNIEDSNKGFKFDWDKEPDQLIGKAFGGIFGREQYEASSGDLKWSTKCIAIRTVEAAQKATPPEDKYVERKVEGADISSRDFQPLPDGENPF